MDDPRPQIPTDRLFTEVYDGLHQMAHNQLRRQPAGHTLQPTALVHEMYLRMSKDPDRLWDNERSFVGYAAAAMRSVLVDHARRKKTGQPLAIEEVLDPSRREVWAVLALNEALAALGEQDPLAAAIAERRIFGGCSLQECADDLDTPLRTVERRWRLARAILDRSVNG